METPQDKLILVLRPPPPFLQAVKKWLLNFVFNNALDILWNSACLSFIATELIVLVVTYMLIIFKSSDAVPISWAAINSKTSSIAFYRVTAN